MQKTRNSMRTVSGGHWETQTQWYRPLGATTPHQLRAFITTKLPYNMFATSGATETIRYHTTRGKRRVDLPCEHFGMRRKSKEVVGTCPRFYGTGYSTQKHGLASHQCTTDVDYEERISGADINPPVVLPFAFEEFYPLDLEDIVRRHYDSVRDPIENGMSLATTLLEAKEFGKLFTQIRDLTDGLSPGLQGGVLANEYGIKPLIRDILDLANFPEQIQRTRKRLETLAHKPISIKTEGQVFVPGRLGSYGTRPPYKDYDSHVKTVWDITPGTARCWMVSKVGYDFRGLTHATLDVLAFNKALGLTNPLKTAWDVVPFSFLIDNNINIGRLARKFDVFQSYAKPRILSSTFHLKMSQTATCYVWGRRWTDTSDPNTAAINGLECGSVESFRYHRWVGLPPENHSIFEGPPGLASLYGDKLALDKILSEVSRKIEWLVYTQKLGANGLRDTLR